MKQIVYKLLIIALNTAVSSQRIHVQYGVVRVVLGEIRNVAAFVEFVEPRFAFQTHFLDELERGMDD